MRGISRYVREDLVESGTISEAVKPLAGTLREYSDVKQIRDTIRDQDMMSLFGVGTSSLVTRGLTSMFLPGSAVMAERVAEELERSKTSNSVTPESIISSAIEGLVIGSTEDKRDTFSMLFGGIFVLITGSAVAFDHFVLRRAVEKIEKVKDNVKERKDRIEHTIDDKVQNFNKKKDRFGDAMHENTQTLKETKNKLKNVVFKKRD